jgi:hypothetical protein
MPFKTKGIFESMPFYDGANTTHKPFQESGAAKIGFLNAELTRKINGKNPLEDRVNLAIWQ